MKTFAFSSAIILLSTFTLMSCSNQGKFGQPVDIVNKDGQTTYRYATAIEASYSATQFKLTCKTPGNCPENVGSMIHHNGKDLSVCTFSLIDEDMAISNRHCISDKIAVRGASCAGIIEFILLKHNSTDTSNIYQCEKVLSVPEEYQSSKSGKSQRDFAIFKIKRKRPIGLPISHPLVDPFKIDTRGIQSGEKLRVIVADPNTETLGANLREQICTSIIHPAFSTNYAVATDPSVTLMNCGIKHGNSGSPVIDEDNKLRAVIKQFAAPEPPSAQKIELAAIDAFARRSVHIREIENKLELAYASNMSCVALPEINLRPFSEQGCISTPQKITLSNISPLFNPEFQTKNAERLNTLKKEANQLSTVLDWQWDQPSSTNWGPEMERHRIVQELTPFCFKGIYDKFNWLPYVSSQDQNGDVIYKINLSADLIDDDIDSSLKLFVVNESRKQSIVIKFNLKELLTSKDHSTDLSIERTGFLLTKTDVVTQKVGFCYHYVNR